jgi:phosphatidate cytidylyltransferase
MSKAKQGVQFKHRERRLSKGSMSDANYDSPNENRSPTRRNGIKNKSPTRSINGNTQDAIKEEERPGVQRTDTTQSGWATDNEDDKVRSWERLANKSSLLTLDTATREAIVRL